MEFKKKEKASIAHRMATAIGVILCVILVPILIANVVLLFKSLTCSDQVPSVGGSSPLVVLSDSMYPEIQSGDLIFVSATEASAVKEGDVICFFDPQSSGNALVTHRVVEVTTQDGQTAWKTQGDANSVEDAELVPAGKLVGTYSGVRFAGLGKVVMFFQSTAVLALCVAVPLLILVAYHIRRRRRARWSVGRRAYHKRLRRQKGWI